MRYSKANTFIFALVFLLAACHSSGKKPFEDTYYQKSNRQWLAALHAFGYKKKRLRNHILLVMHTTECPPCLQELQWWNKRGKTKTDASVSLVVTEKYQTTFQGFLKSQDISFPAYRDSAALLFTRQLIPAEPIKIYFNDRGNVSFIRPVGEHDRVGLFLKKIKSQQEEAERAE